MSADYARIRAACLLYTSRPKFADDEVGKWDVLEICCGQGSWSARVAAGKAVQEFLSGERMTRRERESLLPDLVTLTSTLR